MPPDSRSWVYYAFPVIIQMVRSGFRVVSLCENLVTTSEDYALIENQSTLDGNGYMITGTSQNCIGIKIEPRGSCAVITNFSMISEFYKGIYSDGESVSIFNNVVCNSASAGIHSNGKFSHIYDNFVSDVDDTCIFTFGDYSTVLNNFVMHGRNGVLNHGNYDISGYAL